MFGRIKQEFEGFEGKDKNSNVWKDGKKNSNVWKNKIKTLMIGRIR